MCAKGVASAFDPSAPLAIIAGTGDLPRQILSARQAEGHENFILAIEGNTPETLLDGVAHQWFRIGAVGQAVEALRDRDITQLVMAGNIQRPSLKQIMPDALGAKLLKKLGMGLLAGDDRVLSIIVSFFEEQGFQVLGAHEVCEHLLASHGLLTQAKPDAQALKDKEQAIALLQDLAPHDVGQAVIVQHGYVLGIEAVEGTAALIERAATLSKGDGGVLVKMPKAAQELRADMPAVGVDTVKALAEAGFSGMFVGANTTLMLGKEAMIAEADALSIFIEGFDI